MGQYQHTEKVQNEIEQILKAMLSVECGHDEIKTGATTILFGNKSYF